jgi:hypothetical protein
MRETRFYFVSAPRTFVVSLVFVLNTNDDSTIRSTLLLIDSGVQRANRLITFFITLISYAKLTCSCFFEHNIYGTPNPTRRPLSI